jgi:hypothetical protein
MKVLIVIMSLIVLNQGNVPDFTNITNNFSESQFDELKRFILKKGDRQTYRNFDNNNPHYKLGNADLYLNAETGQENMNNDATLSNFNEISINDPKYQYTIRLVRKGDLKKTNIYSPKGLEENKLYLTGVYRLNKAKLKEILQHLEKIKSDFNLKR